MYQKQHQLLVLATASLLSLCGCTRTDTVAPDPELARLKQDYLQLQAQHRELLNRMATIKQENEAYKAGWAPGEERDVEVERRLVQTQKKLNHQQREYQTLQRDYARLKASIAPLVSRLESSVAAHREELVGTDLGTVTLKNGRQLHRCEVLEIGDHFLRIKFSDGSIRVAAADLPPPLQERFFLDPISVPGTALLGKDPQPGPATTPPYPDSSPIEEAFAKRHRQELEQHRRSIKQKIARLEDEITASKRRIKTLRRNRSKLAREFSQSRGSIRRSKVDRDKALRKIDNEIGQLGLAIEATETQIKSWREELSPDPGEVGLPLQNR